MNTSGWIKGGSTKRQGGVQKKMSGLFQGPRKMASECYGMPWEEIYPRRITWYYLAGEDGEQEILTVGMYVLYW